MPPVKVSKDGLEVLSFGLRRTKMADVVFAAIDFEGHEKIETAFKTTTNSESGISILETRDLLHQSHEELFPPILAQEFVTGSYQRWVKTMKKFRLGTAERLSIYDLSSKVSQCLKIPDDPGNSDFRNVVLVQHARSELQTMLALRLSKNKGLDAVQTVLDIAQMATDLFQLPKGQTPGLEKLAAEAGIPFVQEAFHTAGNDANCILRVLLMLACRFQDQYPSQEHHAGLPALLRKIGQAPLPPPRSESELQQLIALQPTEPLDDPKVPVDTTKFMPRRYKTERFQRGKENQRARRPARAEDVGLSTEEQIRRAANKVLRENVLETANNVYGLKDCDLNIPRDAQDTKNEYT